jgi:hypothetical protein
VTALADASNTPFIAFNMDSIVVLQVEHVMPSILSAREAASPRPRHLPSKPLS